MIWMINSILLNDGPPMAFEDQINLPRNTLSTSISFLQEYFFKWNNDFPFFHESLDCEKNYDLLQLWDGDWREKRAESEVVRECHFWPACLTPDGRLFSSCGWRCRLCKCLEENENRDETEEEPAIERAVIPRIFMRSCHVS